MVVREHGLAAANVFGRCGAAIAPLFAFLQFQLRSSFVPLLVLGCMCLAAGVLAAMLPETLGEKTPDTIQVCAGDNSVWVGGVRVGACLTAI